MSSEHVETVRAYFQATEDHDREGIRRCLGPGYVWIDRAAATVARSSEELGAVAAEFRAWSDVHYEIENAVDAADGSVIVQVVKSGTVNGSWQSMTGTGQYVTYPICEIIRFDGDGRIVHEEGYYDLLSVRRQLGYDGPLTGPGGVAP